MPISGQTTSTRSSTWLSNGTSSSIALPNANGKENVADLTGHPRLRPIRRSAHQQHCQLSPQTPRRDHVTCSCFGVSASPTPRNLPPPPLPLARPPARPVGRARGYSGSESEEHGVCPDTRPVPVRRHPGWATLNPSQTIRSG